MNDTETNLDEIVYKLFYCYYSGRLFICVIAINYIYYEKPKLDSYERK